MYKRLVFFSSTNDDDQHIFHVIIEPLFCMSSIDDAIKLCSNHYFAGHELMMKLSTVWNRYFKCHDLMVQLRCLNRYFACHGLMVQLNDV